MDQKRPKSTPQSWRVTLGANLWLDISSGNLFEIRSRESSLEWILANDVPFPVWCDGVQPEKVPVPDKAIISLECWIGSLYMPLRSNFLMRHLGGCFSKSRKIGLKALILVY